MIVAGSVQLTGRGVTLEEVPALTLNRELRVRECEALDHARLYSAPVGAGGGDRHPPAPRPGRPGVPDRSARVTTSAGSSCCTRSSRPSIRSHRCYEGADHRRRRPARLGSRTLWSATTRARSAMRNSTSPTRRRWTARLPRSSPRSCSTAPRFTTSMSARSSASRRGGSMSRPFESWRCAARCSSTSRPTTSSTAAAASPTARTIAVAAVHVCAHQARGRVRGPGVRAEARSWCAPRASTDSTAARARAATSCKRMVARAREQGALRMVADQRLQPTFTADLAAAIVAAVESRRNRRGAPDRRVGSAPGSSSPRRSCVWPESTFRSSPWRPRSRVAASTGL